MFRSATSKASCSKTHLSEVPKLAFLREMAFQTTVIGAIATNLRGYQSQSDAIDMSVHQYGYASIPFVEKPKPENTILEPLNLFHQMAGGRWAAYDMLLQIS